MDAKKRELLERATRLHSRDELARHLGVPRSLLDAWLSGDTSMPDGKLLVLANALDKLARQKK